MIEFAYCILKIVTACTLFFGAGLLIVFFISSDISNLPGESNMTEKIEQKIEQFWRDATAEDVARVMKGDKVEARFRDFCKYEWSSRGLSGWREHSEWKWIASDGSSWVFCQVYDPPQWYLDRPDPGEGWRLLGKFPHEDLKIGDEAQLINGEWGASYQAKTGGTQVLAMWYRRRIEPVKHDAGSTCASNIPKGWTALSDDEPRLASDAYWSQDAEAWIIVDGWVEAANRQKWPAIRQVESWRCMQLMEGCFYRLPNGQGIEITKEGFELG